MIEGITLPEPCAVGSHEPCIVSRCGGFSVDLVNRCGKCGREIQRATFAGGPGDPWVTEEQHAEEMRELRENDERDEYEDPADRCPPRE